MTKPKTPKKQKAQTKAQEPTQAKTECEAKKSSLFIPTTEEVEKELARVNYKKRYAAVFKSTLFTLITVAAVAILVVTLWLPVLQIHGNSMTPTINSGEIIITVNTDDIQTGDLVAFYYNNKILIKRCIAQSGDWVNIANDGTVYINGEELNEPYVDDKALGECDLELPVQVPESRLFVMGDHRSVSVDSRSSSIGYVSDEQIVGKVVFRVWPLSSFGEVT